MIRRTLAVLRSLTGTGRTCELALRRDRHAKASEPHDDGGAA